LTSPVIYWFRQDLRCRDLPGLAAAAATGQPLLCCYILDDHSAGPWAAGGASRWWLHHSLAALSHELQDHGGQLIFLRGPAERELSALVEQASATAVYCSRVYEPWADALENRLHQRFSDQGVAFKRYPGELLFQPERVRNKAGKPFRVFTPFWKACRAQTEPHPPAAMPHLDFAATAPGLTLEDLALLPRNPDWAAHWQDLWQPGANGASAALTRFLRHALDDYAHSRDHPDRAATSLLSPHLHFGEIAPQRLWLEVRRHCAAHPQLADQEKKFLSELGWREFSRHLLHHFPQLTETPFKANFEHFPWLGDHGTLDAWQRGQTGYPIVDAGMRELWQTGYMHNRVRMITASFLTKHLLLPWQMGQRWFHDTLVDADLANNSCSWQWVAGCGADAAPYFRIFNPTLQGTRFDAEGAYVRRWVPELAALPSRYIHAPDQAPVNVLAAAGVDLGRTYPLPVVEHKAAREAALSAYAALPKP
jgi:deoxyribodipyrimidine photo-lyase